MLKYTYKISQKKQYRESEEYIMIMFNEVKKAILKD